MLAKAVLTRPPVCSKSAIFREAWHIVNLQSCPCPHISELLNEVYNFVLAQDKESQGKNGHNLHKNMGEFGQGLNIYTKK